MGGNSPTREKRENGRSPSAAAVARAIGMMRVVWDAVQYINQMNNNINQSFISLVTPEHYAIVCVDFSSLNIVYTR